MSQAVAHPEAGSGKRRKKSAGGISEGSATRGGAEDSLGLRRAGSQTGGTGKAGGGDWGFLGTGGDS